MSVFAPARVTAALHFLPANAGASSPLAKLLSKEMRGDVLFDAASRERFRREGGVLARLHHPGIAALLDAGLSPQGQPFLVLEYVQGVDIVRWCEQQRLGLCADRLRLRILGDAHPAYPYPAILLIGSDAIAGEVLQSDVAIAHQHGRHIGHMDAG
jgi:serine/threonine protein kinase